jgi:MGT family glycosyltransferase
MSTFIFLSIPAHGHVNPTLPVVTELIARVHRVIYYNAEEFRAKIEATGVEFRAYQEPLPTSHEIAGLIADGNLARVSVMLMRFTERVLPFMLNELEREHPDAVIYDSLCLWGMMAAKQLNLPSMAAITHFVADGSKETKPAWRDILHMLGQALPLVPEIIRLRQRLTRQYPDAFPRGEIFPTRGDRSMVFTTAALQPKTNLINSTFRFVGASINPATRDGDFPQITRKPVVYISLGTLHSLDTQFFREAFAAFADHEGQFILSVGQNFDIKTLGAIPSNFIVHPSVPQLTVLQQSDLFVSHGGMNSVHESLYYGVPLIVVPQQMEQLLNGRIVAAKGAGLLLGDKPPYGHVTAAQLRAAADEVLSNQRYRQNAEVLGNSLREAGGYRQAADEIEHLARELAPAHS